jgi:hypothetical protein
MSRTQSYHYGKLIGKVYAQIPSLPTQFAKLAYDNNRYLKKTVEKYPELLKNDTFAAEYDAFNNAVCDFAIPYWRGYYVALEHAHKSAAFINAEAIDDIEQMVGYLESRDDCPPDYWKALENNGWMDFSNVDDTFFCCDDLGNIIEFMHNGSFRIRDIFKTGFEDAYGDRFTDEQIRYIKGIKVSLGLERNTIRDEIMNRK